MDCRDGIFSSSELTNKVKVEILKIKQILKPARFWFMEIVLQGDAGPGDRT